jgi:snapalysin
MSRSPFTVVAALAALTCGAAVAVAPASSAEPAQTTSAAQAGHSYLPNPREKAQNQRLQKQLDAALRQAAADKAAGRSTSREAAVTVYYDDDSAPSFNSLIDQGAAIWNSRVANVRLVEGTSANASLTYYEGSDPSGSYYYGDGHGSGYILLDYDQANVYAPLRIVTHETGHALGLPDRYTQPCSKLMSGGGPGPSCTNPYPDAVEASEVDSIWRYGFTAAPLSLPKAG